MSPLSKSSWDTCDAKASADGNKQVHINMMESLKPDTTKMMT